MTRKMKDSGIEWIGEIPEDKEIIRTKYLVEYIKGKNPENINTDKKGMPYIGASDLDKKRNFDEYENYTEEKLPECKYNDILILWDGARAGLVGRHHEGIISSTIVNVIPDKNKIDKEFFYWYIKGFERYLYDRVNGTTIPHMNRKYLEAIGMINFQLDEQHKIANFLNDQCTKIDQTIEKEKQVIEKLKEYKQSVITEAVTKGLNPNVRMKDSGVEWIGEIPEHWNILRGKNVLRLLKRPVQDNCEVITCFRDGQVTLRSNRREEGFTFSDKEIGYQGILKGDLVIHGMDGFAGAIGISDSDGKGSPVLNVCKPKNNNFVIYIQYYLRMLASQNVFLALATGIRERSCDLRWNKIANLEFIVPSVNEQQEISNYLDKKCSAIDKLISNKEKVIEKLTEYKKSLIYECVTGKREVQ